MTQIRFFIGLLTIAQCVYSGDSQMQYVGLMLDTKLQTFGVSAVFTMKITGAFKIETHKERERDLAT